MKTISGICMTICIALALAACGGGNDTNGGSSSGGGDSTSSGGKDFSTPKGTMTAIQAAFAANDIEGVLSCYDEEFVKKDGEGMKKEMKEVVDAGGYFHIEFTDDDIKVEGDKATVTTKMKIKPSKDGKEEEEKETFHLEKKGDVWKATD